MLKDIYALYRKRKSTQEDYGDYSKRIQPGEETWKGNVECVAKRRKISFMHPAPTYQATYTYTIGITLWRKPYYQEIIAQVGNQEDANKKNSSEPPQVTKIGKVEIWWDLKIAATSKVPHN